jgi:VIT1/CCC1 family predicted Fe2+/Mn2+ transporter
MVKDNKSIEAGLGFGITSGVITTLGLIVGLDAATHSITAVIGGIIAIAVADAFSDALGIHVHEEAEKVMKHKSIWIATVITFLAKFIFSLTFIIPFLIFKLENAVYVSIAWGLLVLIVYNYRLAIKENKKPSKVIAEHVLIAILVIIITRYVGYLVSLIK